MARDERKLPLEIPLAENLVRAGQGAPQGGSLTPGVGHVPLHPPRSLASISKPRHPSKRWWTRTRSRRREKALTRPARTIGLRGLLRPDARSAVRVRRRGAAVSASLRGAGRG